MVAIMASNPGKPLAFWENPYRSIPGTKGQRYYDINTGQSVSRATYFNAHARAFGFADYGDYTKFSRQFAGGLGGLSGLRVADVKRVKHMFERYEREHHIPKGGIGNDANGRVITAWAQGFLEHPESGKQRTRFVSRLLDVVGIPSYTTAFFAGATP